MDLVRRRCLGLLICKRMYSYLNAHKKRFYENVNIKPVSEGYLIQLDKRTVKTPLLKPLCAPCEPLAIAIANEWQMQYDEIKTSTMPLTTICNTVIDNPTDASKVDTINGMLQFLHTDTICVLAEAPESLVERQSEEWLPVVDWFSKWQDVDIVATSNLFEAHQSDATITKLREYLMNLNKWQLYGLQSSVDVTKSFIIPFTVIQFHKTIEEAISLSRLEVDHQIEKWGNVEFAHELEKQNHTALLAAGTLFYRLTVGLPDI